AKFSFMRGRGSEGHARVFERRGRVHALVLGAEILNSGRACAPWQAVQRRVSFAERDGMFRGNVRKKFAETPDAALVERIARTAAVEPKSFQRRRIRVVTPPNRRSRGSAGQAIVDSGHNLTKIVLMIGMGFSNEPT